MSRAVVAFRRDWQSESWDRGEGTPDDKAAGCTVYVSCDTDRPVLFFTDFAGRLGEASRAGTTVPWYLRCGEALRCIALGEVPKSSAPPASWNDPDVPEVVVAVVASL